ncbi:placenta-specific 8 [Elysia marginata]|uniref:Placenta-specific 8 n=1 Tax=Elysia marginata TaxID=1093978 RepID=A0AAV4IVT3_9GAST|nr:placenta-specific 8 [Elysia marginata]
MDQFKPEVYGVNAPVVSTQPMQQPSAHVMVQQPPPAYPARNWSSGTFDCMDDVPICLFGWFCGLCLACKVSGDMGESMCVPCCLPLPVAILRTKWRTEHNIQGTIMDDCVMSTFCGACSLCQLARDVKIVQRN